MAKIFYVWDVTAQDWIGEVAISIPYINQTSAEVQTELRSIWGGSSGTYTGLSEAQLDSISNLFQASTVETLYPIESFYTYSESDYTFTTADAPGVNNLIPRVKAISGVNRMVFNRQYRLCIANDSTQNYMLLTPRTSTDCWNLTLVNLYGVTSSYGIAIGIIPFISVSSGTPTLAGSYLGFAAFTSNGVATCTVWGDYAINRRNSKYAASSDSNRRLQILYELAEETQPTPEPLPDPYNPGGTSETGGGDGDFGVNRFGDGIDDETITQPDYDALDQLERSVLGSNFVSIYNPTRANVQALKNYLWSSQIGDTLKKLYNNPMDSIISLHMVPVTPTTTTGTIHIGGTDTEVEGRPVTNQYVTLSCGSLTIGEYWAAYLDYNPYTKLYLYLPFCGMHSVDTDEFMGQTLSIRYDVDVVTGDCLCSVSGSRAGGMSTILYQYAGNCSVEIPVSAANYNARISAGLGLVGSAVGIAAAAATGGMTAPLAATAVASTAANVLSGKTRVERSGALAGSAAWMGPLKPYLILVQPTQCLPDGQASFTGYPSYITAAVGDLTGYTEFAEIHLDGIAATDAEKAEIEQILRTGVIL